jgi:predicted molibdopterin-dependent oxidoreductase YjgC
MQRRFVHENILHIRKAVEPQGDVKPDWAIISEVATAMGYPMSYANTGTNTVYLDDPL